MVAVVPRFSELLNLNPNARYPLEDSNITVRCPKSDCFAFQSLADATLTRGLLEARYDCKACATPVAIVRSAEVLPGPDLTMGDMVGDWVSWVPASGINIRLANTTRLRTNRAPD